MLILAAISPGTVAGAIRVAAQVEESEDIYAGDSFTYYVIIDGQDKPAQIDLGPLAKYNPQPAGQKNLSQSHTTIINNKRTDKVTKRYVMIYKLVVAEAGVVQLPRVDVTVDGKVYTTNTVSVKVQKPNTTNKMDFKMALSKESCYAGEPVVFTAKWLIHPDIVKAVGDFAFNVPAFSSGDFYIEDVDSGGNVPQPNRKVNGVDVSIAQQPIVYKGINYAQVLFSKVLIPKRSGRIEIDPAVVSADIAVGRQRRGIWGSQLQYKRFMAKSEPLVLDVTALPNVGKPKDFYGLIGKYSINTSAEPTEVYMGEPITLTIKIGGNKYLKPIKWPVLEDIEELSSNFKIPTERSSPVIEKGFKIFTQTIRANDNDVSRIPPIPLVYFDVDKGEHVTAESAPIDLEVTAAKKATAADMEGREIVSANSQVEAVKKGIAANYEEQDALVNQEFSATAALVRPGYLAMWAGPLAAFLLSLIAKSVMYTSDEKAIARRRRQACGRAVARLKKINTADTENARQLVISVMKDYIGQRFDRTSSSLTGADCQQVIIERGGGESTGQAYCEIIESCEAAYYAGGDMKFDSGQIGRIIEIIRKIDKKTKK